MNKIPATVITGFLGAGKTSVIRHMLENAGGKRIALVINEFGDLGIDRELVIGCGIEGCEDENVMELANGCICCTVADDFLPTMEALLDRPEPPEHIVIETSGLALPKPLVKAFNWPEIRSRVTVDGVVTVVDAPAVAAGQFADDPDAVQDAREADEMLDHESPLEEVFEDQLLCADMVLLNKSDLLDGDALDGVRAEVRSGVATQVKLVDAVHGAIDPKILLGIGAGVEEIIEGRWSHHDADDDHDHDDFESFVLTMGDIINPEDLEKRIKACAVDHDILRVKGFVNVPGKDMRHVVQAVGARVQRYYDRPWLDGEVRRSSLVIIGEVGLDQDAIGRALDGN
ncbi:MAG: cobalamin biosynthesis protein CobW [Magnetovibrio sp.]|nr:cobalamin biosynthesis protein CobW [Magnetovibrio sp.]|tara:strand:+ start:182 stop:1210 length:1029 start_codon:yes stop_codon:yes gene_type:complete